MVLIWNVDESGGFAPTLGVQQALNRDKTIPITHHGKVSVVIHKDCSVLSCAVDNILGDIDAMCSFPEECPGKTVRVGAPVINKQTLDVLAVNPVAVDTDKWVFCDREAYIKTTEQMDVLDIHHHPQNVIVEEQLVLVLFVQVFVDAVHKEKQGRRTSAEWSIDVIDLGNILGNPTLIDIEMQKLMKKKTSHAVGDKNKLFIIVFFLYKSFVFGKQFFVVFLVMDKSEIIRECVHFIIL
jgi:hypothetical protein